MSNPALRQLIEQLDTLGWFDRATPGGREGLKQRCLERGEVFPGAPYRPSQARGHHTNILGTEPDLTLRWRGADAENVAENGPVQFFMELAAWLHYDWNFDIDELRQERQEDGSLLVTLNGDTRRFYSREDMEGCDWAEISLRAVAMLNAALDRSGTSTEERFYLSHVGENDQTLLMLKPAMYELIREHRDIWPDDWPVEAPPDDPLAPLRECH